MDTSQVVGEVKLRRVASGRRTKVSVLQVEPRYLKEQMRGWHHWAVAHGIEGERFNWPAIARNRPGFGLLALDWRGTAQAVIQFSDTHRFTCEHRILSGALYVTFLEVAPWNRVAAGAHRILREVGLNNQHLDCNEVLAADGARGPSGPSCDGAGAAIL